MTMTHETLLALPYDNGEVYVIGEVPGEGLVLAVETMETQEGSQVLVAIEGTRADPVPLDSMLRFQVPIEFYDEPVRWEGRV